ncbi:hypothetical protein DV454_000068 [Geotrichum candidum]|nr:hypothetical protein DV454_000068 [Geotrichum candidum]
MSIELLSTAFNQKLSFSEENSILTFNQANAALVEQLGGKFPQLNAEQSAEQSQWLTVSQRFPEGLEQLNETLKARTYLLNTQELSLADVVVYSRVQAIVAAFTEEQIKAQRHIVRWLDLVQHSLSGVPQIAINLDLEAPREIKAKPEKKKAKPAEAAAPKESKGKKVKADKKAGADKKADPAAAPAAGEAPANVEQKRTEKKEKKKKEKKPQPVKVEVPVTPGMIDLRVGHIQKAIRHPDADSLYVSTIDLGEETGPRTVCSGLVKYYPLEAMQDRYVVIVANLKPVNMRGIKSTAMVLCASNKEDGIVEFVNPPAGSKPGDKIFFEGFDLTPEAVLNPKKKIWEQIQPGFTTTEDLDVIYRKEGDEDRKLVNKKGEHCKVNSLVGAAVN